MLYLLSIKDTEFDGMIHYKDLSWSEKDSELENYKKNQQIKFKILEINQESEKIRLGIKQLSNDPFEFFMDKNLSDIVTVVVELSSHKMEFMLSWKEKFSILIKKNQLAKERVENQRPQDLLQGDKLDV